MREHLSSISRFMLLPAALGLLAGVAGGLAGFSYYLAGTIDTNPIPSGHPAFVVTAPLPETELAKRLSAMDVALYTKKTLPTGDLGDRALVPEKAVAHAAVLTSDGWLLTTLSALKAGPIVAAVGQKLFDPKTQIIDQATGAVFLKIDAGPFQVSGFEETDKLRSGSALYTLDGSGGYAKAEFAGVFLAPKPNRPEALRSSEAFSRVWRFDAMMATSAAGGPVLTVSGNLAGVLVPVDGSSATFIPMHLLRGILSDTFRGQAIKRPTLGVNYVDLGNGAFAGDVPDRNGFVLASSKRTGIPAVVAASPAAQAGLMEGDVLMRIDGIDLVGGRDLAELLADYPPGAKIDLDVRRPATGAQAPQEAHIQVVLR